MPIRGTWGFPRLLCHFLSSFRVFARFSLSQPLLSLALPLPLFCLAWLWRYPGDNTPLSSLSRGDGERYLFYTLGEHGNCAVQPLTHKAVDCLLRRVRKDALITKRITPHTTRHTFATTLLDKGVDLKTVQELLGHSHIRTTEKYLHTSDEKKMDAIARLQFAL